VVTSILTLVDSARGIARARLSGRIKETKELAALRLLDDAAASWHLLDISDHVAARARRSFPHEPVRTLDALHLASTLVLAEAPGPLRVLSVDDRVRLNATAVGMTTAAPGE
jgi:hypothetical protein